MQHAVSFSPSFPANPESNPVFSVVIAYEDFESGKHAKQVYDFLVETLGGEYELSNQMWKFDVLGIPKLRELASADAAAADLVVISCRGHELPDHTREWIESWLSSPTRPLALVALFECPFDHAGSVQRVRAYLAAAARRGQMEFFAHPDESPAATDPQNLSIVPERKAGNQPPSTGLGGALQSDLPQPRWSVFD